jgi:hypothetical protein
VIIRSDWCWRYSPLLDSVIFLTLARAADIAFT